jgi:hypothetical protein
MKSAVERGFSLRSVVALVVLCAVFVGCAFAYVVLARGNHQAMALLRYEQPMASYRRVLPQLCIEQSFARWSSMQSAADAEAVRRLQRVFASPDTVQRFVSPFFRLTRRDVRDVVAATKQQEGEAFDLSGLELTAFADSPKTAAAMVALGAAFIRDVALRDALLSYSTRGRATAQESYRLIENEAIARRFEVRQLELKRAELQRVQRLYPDSAQFNQRQLLSTSGDGSRFLPPLVQLVGVESELIDKQRELARLERAARQNKLLEDFYTSAVHALEQTPGGVGSLAALESLRQQQSAKQAVVDDDALKEVDNRIHIALSALRDSYVSGPVFISGDAITTGPRVRPSVLVIVSVLAAVAVWLLLRFGTRTLDWLKDGTRTPA